MVGFSEQSALSMSAPELTIRDAVLHDAGAMGRLHVLAWQSAYRGVMPDEYLDGLVAEERIEMWHQRLSRADLHPPLVAAVRDVVVGFAAFGAEDSPTAAEGCGELYAVNLDPDHWGRGIGRALVRRVTERLISMGFREAVLWVVPENQRARALYESEGWVADGGIATEDVLGVTVTDIRYRTSLIDESRRFLSSDVHAGEPTAHFEGEQRDETTSILDQRLAGRLRPSRGGPAA
jgi:ribosomal protein S18 acetylase RimI-like enzyme